MIVSMVYSVQRSVNDAASTKKGHTKASRTFQLMIYNGLIELFQC